MIVLIVATYPLYRLGFFLSLKVYLIVTCHSASCNVSCNQNGLFLVGGSLEGESKGYICSMGLSTISFLASSTEGTFSRSILSSFFSGGGRGRSLSFPRETS